MIAALALRSLLVWRRAEPAALGRLLVPLAAAGLPAAVATLRFRRYTGGPTDALMSRLFPPRP